MIRNSRQLHEFFALLLILTRSRSPTKFSKLLTSKVSPCDPITFNDFYLAFQKFSSTWISSEVPLFALFGESLSYAYIKNIPELVEKWTGVLLCKMRHFLIKCTYRAINHFWKYESSSMHEEKLSLKDVFEATLSAYRSRIFFHFPFILSHHAQTQKNEPPSSFFHFAYVRWQNFQKSIAARRPAPERARRDVSNLADTYFVFWSSFRFSLKAPSFIVFIPSLSWLSGHIDFTDYSAPCSR